jgi:hypothetical protein
MKGASALMSVLESLHFQEDRSDRIARISPEKWTGLLVLTDEAQLTLPLAIRHRSFLPRDVQSRVDLNIARSTERANRTRDAYVGIARELESRGVEFAVLKGMTHFPSYCDDLAHRPQFDVDLFFPRESIQTAVEVIAGLGYEAHGPTHRVTADHFPTMIRKTGFLWKGDYYDPELPLAVELHYRFWNPGREGFRVSGDDAFWSRRESRNIGGCMIPALHPADDLAYTTWHLVKHLLRGNLRLYHVYELAHFLNRMALADSFWNAWEAGTGEDRIAEPIAFRLASEWFGCRMHPVVRQEIDRLPAAVDRWFRLFAFSPVPNMEAPNKDELFLHLALLRGAVDRIRVTAHKFLPMSPPRVVMDAHVEDDTFRMRARRVAFFARFLLRRASHHVRAWSPIVQSGFRWWLAKWHTA